jgi:hypothetical protein
LRSDLSTQLQDFLADSFGFDGFEVPGFQKPAAILVNNVKGEKIAKGG